MKTSASQDMRLELAPSTRIRTNGSFRIRGTLFGGPYNKDANI